MKIVDLVDIKIYTRNLYTEVLQIQVSGRNLGTYEGFFLSKEKFAIPSAVENIHIPTAEILLRDCKFILPVEKIISSEQPIIYKHFFIAWDVVRYGN